VFLHTPANRVWTLQIPGVFRDTPGSARRVRPHTKKKLVWACMCEGGGCVVIKPPGTHLDQHFTWISPIKYISTITIATLKLHRCPQYSGLTEKPKPPNILFLGVKINLFEIYFWVDGTMGDWEGDHNSHFIAFSKGYIKNKIHIFFNFLNKLQKNKRKIQGDG
jgi:hypothetical protein